MTLGTLGQRRCGGEAKKFNLTLHSKITENMPQEGATVHVHVYLSWAPFFV